MENQSENAAAMKMVVTKSEPSFVAPAMETPKCIYYLSNLDQNLDLDLATIIHAIYIFKAKEKKSEIAVDVLKEALGKVLVHYYPLAGRLVFSSDGKQIVDCTGEGALFVEAEVDCELKEIEDMMTIENIPTLEKFVYIIPGAETHMDYPPIVAQVTKLKCGGFVLATSMNHCLLDGRAASEFMNSWGETARNLPLSVPPFLDRTLLKPRTPLQVSFPHHEFDDIDDLYSNLYSNDQSLVHTCFLFNQQKLSHLKQEAMKHNTLKSCTTFEALSGFIWRTRTQALNLHPNQKVKLLLSIDGRTRFDPPLPRGFSGNAVFLAGATCCAGELTTRPLSFAVGLVQEAVRVVKDDYMRSAIDFLENGRVRPRLTATTLLIAGWSRLSYLNTDFGWGVPVKTATLGSQVKEKELCTFLSGGGDDDGKSIHAKLCLPSSIMQLFEIAMEQNLCSLLKL